MTTDAPAEYLPEPQPQLATPTLGRITLSVNAGAILLALLDSIRVPGGQQKIQLGMAQLELAKAMAPYIQPPATQPQGRAARRAAQTARRER